MNEQFEYLTTRGRITHGVWGWVYSPSPSILYNQNIDFKVYQKIRKIRDKWLSYKRFRKRKGGGREKKTKKKSP